MLEARLQHNGEQQHDGDQDECERKGDGMANAHGGVEADVDLAAVLEVLLNEGGSGIRNGEQALHKQGGHTRDKHEHGTEGNTKGENGGCRASDVSGVEVGNAADDDTDDGAYEDGLAKDAELLLHGLNVDIDVTHARDLVDNPVDEHGDGREGRGEAVRQGHAGHTERLLNLRSGNVAQDEHHNLVNHGSGEAEHDVIGDDGHNGTGESEVPIVPDVHVGRLGGVGEQHDDVHKQAKRNDEEANGGAHGDCRRRRPAHIDDVEGQTKAGGHLLNGGRQVGAEHVVDDQVQADEAHTNGEAGLEALTKAGTQNGTDDGKDDGHHYGDAQALNKGEES